MTMDIKKEKAIEALINGENISDTARLANVNRKTIYRWMEEPEFKANWDERLQAIKNYGNQKLGSKLTTYIEEMEKIALTGRSEKNRKDALEYLINRTLGSPTSKTADVTNDEEEQDKVDRVELENEFEKFRMKKLK